MALLLAALAVAFALLHFALAVRGAALVHRARSIAAAALVLVVAPSVALVAMGFATDRPYGQDGGVVQLPLALDKIVSGESPYGADYSGTMLGRQARASTFWDARGENPILHHHAYLPGTHLAMAPFYLVARGLGVPFDPRFVTLLFYALTIALASRLPTDGGLRLAAAGVAALNPLVYWHQIFGANDLVFVAMVLGAVLLARGGRSTAAGAMIGLACATKQLAWPYAPFVLLALTGARRMRDLGAKATWERTLRPLGAAAGLFLAVVLPVAALDFRAFWGDIVVYNVGLPGADNYPLGGTPGFGFANFLVYFGRVRSLRDYFPFGVFYLLLVPLGLLLVRRQLREGTPVAALYTGTAALLLSLYFSRVVHPNYLIPAAVLLPLAFLGLRRQPDVAVAPLLLLLLAVEIAENAVFREAGEQAAAAGLPARLGGLVSALRPRAGPDLTPDPLGLLVSAIAAGAAVVSLVAAALGLGRKGRLAVLGLGAAVVATLPAGFLGTLSERTGIVRAQDRWAVQVQADAARLAAGKSPYASPPADTPIGREAFSTSFRLEPPHELVPDRPLTPPGTSSLVALLRPFGLRDPRPLLLAALATLACLAWFLGNRSRGPVAILPALVPPLVMGSVLGSPTVLPTAALFGSFLAAQRAWPAVAGVLSGMAVAFDHRAILVAPFVVFGPAPTWRRVAGGLALGYGLLVLPAAVLDPAAWLAHSVAPLAPMEPGMGLASLFSYWGLAPNPVALLLASVLAAAALLALVAKGRLDAFSGAILASLCVVLLGGESSGALGLPLALLALGGFGEGRDVGGERPDQPEG